MVDVTRTDWIEVVHRPFEDGPPLPALQRSGRPWPAWTRRWWRAISRMPHCVLWTAAEWRYALDTAMVAAAVHSGDLKQAKELRQREAVLGTTLDARRQLRIRYVDDTADRKAAGPAAIESYRRRLMVAGRGRD